MQVSKFLKISLTTLRRWREGASPKISFTKPASGVIRYRIEDVESFKEITQNVKETYVRMDYSERAIRSRLKSCRIYEDGNWLS